MQTMIETSGDHGHMMPPAEALRVAVEKIAARVDEIETNPALMPQDRAALAQAMLIVRRMEHRVVGRLERDARAAMGNEMAARGAGAVGGGA